MPLRLFSRNCQLTEEESDRYLEISRKLAQICHAKGQLTDSDASINPLLLQRGPTTPIGIWKAGRSQEDYETEG